MNTNHSNHLPFILSLATLAISLFVGSAQIQAQGTKPQTSQELDQAIEARIVEIEAAIKKATDPIDKKMLRSSLEQMKNRELTVTRFEPSDRWNLVDVQFLPGPGSKSSKKVEQNRWDKQLTEIFNFSKSVSRRGIKAKTTKTSKKEGSPTTKANSSFDISIIPPPKSLKPGEIFSFGAEVTSNRNGNTGRAHGPPRSAHPSLKFFKASGSQIREDRTLKSLRHVDEAGKPSREKTRTILETRKDGKKTRTTYRVEFPKSFIPFYVRYGIKGGGGRVVFVYKWNGKPVVGINVGAFDANPMFHQSTFPEDLPPSELIRSSVQRDGTSADGVSQLLIKAELGSNTKVKFSLKKFGDGDLVPLLGGRTVTLSGKHYAFALYTPPGNFGGGSTNKTPVSLFDPAAQPKLRLGDVLEYRRVNFKVETVDRSARQSLEIKLARPPVVMVHGFLSDPYNCWVKTKDSGTGMTVLLEKAGLLPFVVNYERTNGTPFTAAAASSFAANARVVWDRADPWSRTTYYDGWIKQQDERPILSEFQREAPMRIGGIKQSLEYYRDKFNLAVTQADVVGHSMGGLLARVYASEHYHPDYKRAENFSKGDIHRLITLNTPHHGSELTHVYDALTKGWIENETWAAWATRIPPRLAGFFIGIKTPAVLDLTAPLTTTDVSSSALGKIGPTSIPSFAIATTADHSQFMSKEYDEHRIYLKAFGTVGMAFFHNRPLLDDFVRTRARQWRDAPTGLGLNKSALDGASVSFDDEAAIENYISTINRNLAANQNVYFWEKQRQDDHLDSLIEQIRKTKIYPYGSVDNERSYDEETLSAVAASGISKIFLGGDITKLEDTTKDQDVPPVVISMIRELIFHNDPMNDGAVRVESQFGGLPDENRKLFEKILHSFSPWHYQVQRKVIELLKWEDHKFAPNGFKNAGQLCTRYLPSARPSNDRVEGAKAVRWSGVVPSHAVVYAKIADRRKVVILVRPVNRDSTKLIKNNAATKSMDVKGKSSNWGPQKKGFIPVNQRYSKLWQVFKNNPVKRDAEIVKYGKETKKVVKVKHPILTDRFIATPRALTITIAEKEYDVFTDPGEKEDAEKAIYLHHNSSFYDWKTMEPRPVSAKLAKTLTANPLTVLSDSTRGVSPFRYLTADYDLLAIGYFEGLRNGKAPIGVPNDVKEATFDSLMGFVSKRQKTLIDELNEFVELEAKYKGGKVTHHGPEVQYAKSPYVDYPILVCDPGEPEVEGDQSVFIIRQGPPGFRDMHLKQYFSEQIRKGFQLWPNPASQGWLWEAYRSFDQARGYDPRDAINLLSYVAEQSDPDLDSIDPDTATSKVAFKYYQAKARAGDPDAQANLALLYLDGKGTEPDLKLYHALAKESANSGASIGLTIYAQALLEGLGGASDQPQGIKLLEQAIEQDNYPDAILLLASSYQRGMGVTENHATAYDLFRRASDLGNSYADFELGLMYFSGDHVKADRRRAFEYFQKAAKDDVAEAHTFIGDYHAQGILGQPNLRKAILHYRKAIELEADVVAMHSLALILLGGGKGVAKDQNEAASLFKTAAEAGFSDSMIELGNCYRIGLGLSKDLVRACTWYKLGLSNYHSDQLKADVSRFFQSLSPDQKSEVLRQIQLRTESSESQNQRQP